MQRWFVYDKGAFSTQIRLFIKHEALMVWLIYKYDGAYDLSPKPLIAGSVHCVTAFFVVLSMNSCVHITTCFVWQLYFICRPIYICVCVYIYVCVHIKRSFKTKTDRDLHSGLRTKWGKSIAINFSLFSSLWF